MPNYLGATEIEDKIYKKVYSFMIGNRINCEEAIYQCDWVIENAYEFIEDLFKIIKPNLPLTEYED